MYQKLHEAIGLIMEANGATPDDSEKLDTAFNILYDLYNELRSFQCNHTQVWNRWEQQLRRDRERSSSN